MTIEDVKAYLQRKKDNCKVLWPLRSDYNVRLSSIQINIFKDHLFDAHQQRKSIPELDLTLSKLAVNFSSVQNSHMSSPQDQMISLKA